MIGKQGFYTINLKGNDVVKNKWDEIGPAFTKQLLAENPEQELAAMRTAKLMGDMWKQVAELTDYSRETAALIQQLRKEHAAVTQSHRLQEERHKKQAPKNNRPDLTLVEPLPESVKTERLE